MNFRHIALITSIAILTGCNSSMKSVGGQDSSALSDNDNAFFKKITIANETEIQSSELALTATQTQSIKDFAQHMIDDHREAEGKVSALAGAKGVMLPTKLDDKHDGMVQELKTTGSGFDRAYINMQIAAHKETIAADQDEIDHGTDPQVKQLATDLLPTLQMHEKMAETVKGGM